MKLQRRHAFYILLALICAVGATPWVLAFAGASGRQRFLVVLYFLPIAIVLGIHFRLKNKQYREQQELEQKTTVLMKAMELIRDQKDYMDRHRN